ncbi:transporter substrate-binding domain-containing protein [Breoghania sp.]|uniref:substrate-binding periplasmic protein n=1 Tax=Breoghania sp. TaxID=2065378 RepID=UPI002611BACC|nr:transporter substrate-binding domain-containing protein [Breoghania sp.]MDJ0932176.1 transporter substrate-binding domain-containing protein [Breoghania sp.]
MRSPYRAVCPRIAQYSEIYPDLLPIREPAIVFEFVAFTRDGDIRIHDWEELGDYSVGHLTGSVILTRNAQQYAGSVTVVKNVNQLFRLLDLELGRIDVVLIERWTGLYMLKTLGCKGIHMQQPALERQPLYFSVNRQHATLVPRIEAALREMKSDGTYDRTMVRILNPLPVGF